MSTGALPPMSIQPLADGDPRQFGQFRTIGRLGSGRMGEAFLAESADSWVVVKAIRSAGQDTRELAARMGREVEAMQRVDSPLVAKVLASDLDADRPWFALEFIPGLSLAQRVSQFGSLDPLELNSLAMGLAKCIEAVHSAGVIHRDLKPDNVVLGSTGPRLIDFGIAEVAEGTDLTAVGNVVGTMLWMAPEQMSGGQVTPSVDVHAWGLLMVYGASGEIPFEAESGVAIMYRALHEAPTVPGSVRDPLAGLVARALGKDPAQRPTAPELVRDLGAVVGFVAGVGSSAAPQPSAATSAAAATDPSNPPFGRAPSLEGSASAQGGRPTDDGLDPELDASGPTSRGTEQPPIAEPGLTPKRKPGSHGLLVVVSLLALLVLAGWWLLSRGDAAATTENSATPVQVEMPDGSESAAIARISLGDRSSCIAADNGRAYCWGANDSGQLGSAGGQSSEPREVDRLGVLQGATIVRVSVGAEHACALDAEGRAYCWGSNDQGQLGTAKDVASSDAPVEVSTQGVLASKVLILIGTSADTTCALDDGGRLYCWGANGDGQFGNGTTTGSALPVSVDTTGALADRAIRRFAVGENHTCAIDVLGVGYCWGANDKGQLGTGTTQPSLVPVPVAPPPGAGSYSYSSISVGGMTSCGWSRDGAVTCWGEGASGQLGTGSLLDVSSPQWVVFSEGLKAGPISTVNVGGRSVCAAAADGRAFCWGKNDVGQLGDASRDDSPVPVEVVKGDGQSALPYFNRIAASEESSCAVATDGTAWCWGTNSDGRLGAGLTGPR